jgi:cysteinyl-tRNA synthetase, unknown class
VVVLGAACTSNPGPPEEPAGSPTTRERLRAALSHSPPWVSYYGSGRLADLGTFGVVDIDVERGAGNYTAADVARLQDQGALVVTYLNVGAAETFRAYWPRVRRFSIEPYEGYPGEHWMEVERPAYRRVLLDEVVPQLVEAGVDGFYLDNLDIVQEPFATAETVRGVVAFVSALRSAYPDLIMVAQNGLEILGERDANGVPVHRLVDAEAKEDPSATFGDRYRKVAAATSA